MFKKTNNAVDCIILALLFFAVGLITRMPAMLFWQSVYGLHGLLVAPLFSLIMAFYITRKGRVWPVLVGALACAAFLGIMSPVMLCSIAVPVLLGGIAYAAARCWKADNASFLGSLVFGSFSYPATVGASLVLGGYHISIEALMGIAIMGIIGIAACILGSLLGQSLALRTQSNKLCS